MATVDDVNREIAKREIARRSAARAGTNAPRDSFNPDEQNLGKAAAAGFQRGALANASLEPGDIEGGISAAANAKLPGLSDVGDVIADNVKSIPSKVVPRGIMSAIHSLAGLPDEANDAADAFAKDPSLAGFGRVAGNAATSLLPASGVDGSHLIGALRILNPGAFDDAKAKAQIAQEDAETPAVDVGGAVIPPAALTQYLASAGLPGADAAAGAGANVAREAAADVAGAAARAAPTVGKVGGAALGAKAGAGIGSVPAAFVGWKAGGAAGRKAAKALKSVEDALRPLAPEAPRPRDLPADVMTGAGAKAIPPLDVPADVMTGNLKRTADAVGNDLYAGPSENGVPFESNVPVADELPPSMLVRPTGAGGADWHLTPEQIRGETPIPAEVQAEIDAVASRAKGAPSIPAPPPGKTGVGGAELYSPEGIGAPTPSMRAKALDDLEKESLAAPAPAEDIPADVMASSGPPPASKPPIGMAGAGGVDSLADQVRGLEPAQRIPRLREIAKAYGKGLAQKVAKVANVSLKANPL